MNSVVKFFRWNPETQKQEFCFGSFYDGLCVGMTPWVPCAN